MSDDLEANVGSSWGDDRQKRMLITCVCVSAVVALLVGMLNSSGEAARVRELGKTNSALESELESLKQRVDEADALLRKRSDFINETEAALSKIEQMATANSESRAALTGDRWTATNHDRYDEGLKFWLSRTFDAIWKQFGVQDRAIEKVEDRLLEVERGGRGEEVLP